MGLLMCSIFSFVFTDMLFLQGSEAIFKVALSLLGSHKPLILQHENLETIVDFIKNTLPNLGLVQMEKTISQVWKNLNVWVICKEIIFFFNKFLAENSQQCIVTSSWEEFCNCSSEDAKKFWKCMTCIVPLYSYIYALVTVTLWSV